MISSHWKKQLSVLLVIPLILTVSLAKITQSTDKTNTIIQETSPAGIDNMPLGSSLSNSPNNITILVEINRIRCANEETNTPHVYLDIFIDGQSAMWWQDVFTGKEITIEWPVAAATIPYTPEEPVYIDIQLWEKHYLGRDQLCDISQDTGGTSTSISLVYDVKRGEWTGDDFLHDSNGYGHTSGYEDGSYDQNDYEIWFDIYQLTGHEYYSGYDRLTWYEKQNIYGLDSDLSQDNGDIDGDGIPSWWEDKYGYDPLTWEDHENRDPDNDGLSNSEEYLTHGWYSDPYAQDIFIEVDYMQGKHPWNKPYIFPKESQYLICNAFAKHNINVHFDDGALGGGGDLLPYDEGMDGSELESARLKYFLQGDPTNWRLGVFHYAIVCSQMEWSGRPAGGRMFYTDSHCVGGQYVRNWAPLFYLQGSDYYTGFASVFMHELGHTLGLHRFEGIDNENSRFPWNEEYWDWGPYYSCMNYRYVYKLVDYSNGDDEEYDQNDWGVINLTLINNARW